MRTYTCESPEASVYDALTRTIPLFRPQKPSAALRKRQVIIGNRLAFRQTNLEVAPPLANIRRHHFVDA
jgi:hypothetical protein